ncbi:aspartic peptidase domain-containing protein [Mycena crocata]|nr:aspartic peptidase domain-containing protein [Mycena crocata]
MWWSSAWPLILVASPSLAAVLGGASTPSHSATRSFLAGRSISAFYVPTVNATGTLENNPQLPVTTIKLNGREFKVGIDTGSTDLVIVTTSDFEFDTKGSTPVSAGYGSGNLTGNSGFARMELGEYSFPNQAFVNITNMAGDLGIGNGGIDGILGLSFGGGGFSPLSLALKIQGPEVQPFLLNVFDAHPDDVNLIAISLSRTDDLESSAEETFTIMEVSEKFAAVTDTTPVPLFPGDSGRWSVLVDRITVDGVNIPIVANVKATPKGSLVAVIDTGTTLGTLPPDTLYAIYSQIPGASFEVDGDKMNFIIPCNATSIVTFVIGELKPSDNNGVVGVVCRGAFAVFPGGPHPDFDALFGDTSMRNVYSVFNFGDAASKTPTKKASMQFLSTTDSHAATSDVLKVRMIQIASMDPEVQSLLPGFRPALPGSINPLSSNDPHFSNAAIADGSDTDGSPTLHEYALTIIGLVGANFLVVLILAVIGVGLYVKRGRRSGSPSEYAHVRFKSLSGGYNEDQRYSE